MLPNGAGAQHDFQISGLIYDFQIQKGGSHDSLLQKVSASTGLEIEMAEASTAKVDEATFCVSVVKFEKKMTVVKYALKRYSDVLHLGRSLNVDFCDITIITQTCH